MIAGDRSQLLDQDVVSEDVCGPRWRTSAAQDGYGGNCVSSGSPTRCELNFASSYRIDYCVAMERAENANGWQVTEVGVGTP